MKTCEVRELGPLVANVMVPRALLSITGSSGMRFDCRDVAAQVAFDCCKLVLQTLNPVFYFICSRV
jgi:hypothetical protein